jgi:hypothetical protein
MEFPTCPRCGSDVVNAKLTLEKTRFKRVVIASIIAGTVISVLVTLIQLLLE